MLRLIRSAAAVPFLLVRRHTHWLWELQNRERARLLAEMSQTRGLIPLLMKQRNGYRWSAADRRRIKAQIRTLAFLSPYLILLLAPGGILALPALAWWLDRRRAKRAAETQRSMAD